MSDSWFDQVRFNLVSSWTWIFRIILGSQENLSRFSHEFGLAELLEIIRLVQFGPLLRSDVLIHSRNVLLSPGFLNDKRLFLLLEFDVDTTKFM